MNSGIARFEEEVRTQFSFLIEQYGCRRPRVDKHAVDIVLMYRNPTTAVKVSYDVRDNFIIVYLIRVEGDKADNVGRRYGRDWFDIVDLLRAKGQSTEFLTGQRDYRGHFTAEEITIIVKQCAEALKRHGADVLRSDFSELVEIVKRKER